MQSSYVVPFFFVQNIILYVVILQADSKSSLVKKTTVIDDDHDSSSVTSLKNFHKLQKGHRKNKNRVAPTDLANDNLERPTSAPTNRTRQWLKEINENRPMTAAAAVVSRPVITCQFESG